jgi:hypothetical protein
MDAANEKRTSVYAAEMNDSWRPHRRLRNGLP